MTDTTPDLSICIATFNRAELLRGTLDTVACQVAADGDGAVEVVVGDNCSNDGTEAVGREFARRYPFARYLRHECNLGAEGNFRALAQRASGRFVWLLSDDDFLLDGAVAKVLRTVRLHPEVAFIFVNYRLWSEAEQAVSGESGCVANGDGVVTGADEFNLLVRYANSFISSCVCRRSEWLAATARRRRDTYWPQLHLANEILEGERGFVIAHPQLMMRCVPAMASRLEKKRHGDDHFYLDAHVQFIEFLEDVSRQTRHAELQRLNATLGLRANFFQIMIYKCVAGRYEPRYLWGVFRRLAATRRFRTNVLFWVRDVPTLFGPAIVSKCIYRWQERKKEISKWGNAPERRRRLVHRIYRALAAVAEGHGK